MNIKFLTVLFLSIVSLSLMAVNRKTVIYKTTPNGDKLRLFVFNASSKGEIDKPAMVMFHGGGWQGGNPKQFFAQCQYYANKGYVSISVEYRLCPKDKPQNTHWNTVEDARSAMRYIKKNAKELGINPDRIIAAGSSAGAHLAICSALLNINDKNDDLTIDPSPKAVILMCPVVDARYKHLRKHMPERFKEFSPIDNLRKNMPPQLILLGDKDHILKVKDAKRYKKMVEEQGCVCELVIYKDAKHASFYKGKYFEDSKSAIDKFLKKY